ncbi:MAG TPA: serine hydrolase [Chitinophagaceae bacterium]|nr:serine hydrolase [Chitinophagaceae bacterium]
MKKLSLKTGLYFCILLIQFKVYCQDKRTEEIAKMMQYAENNAYYNGAIAVVEKGKIIYSKGIGYSDIDTKTKNDENTLFNLCSISKQFTAMGIMMLNEEDKLSYNDKLEKYFPELNYPGVTIRHMLNHTSGLPDYLLTLIQVWQDEQTPTNSDAIRVLANSKLSAKFTPGEKYEYSNTGYMLLATILEKVGGKTYEQFLKERIFNKLGMKRTAIYLRGITPKIPENFARPYAYDAGLNKFVLTSDFEQYRRQVATLDGNYGDGGVYSSIADMLSWDNELKNIRLVKKETLQEAFTSGKNNEGKEIGYGFGWFIMSDPLQGKIVQHTGGWPGYRQAFVRYLDKDRTLLVLRNTEINFSSIQLAIQNILDEKPWTMPRPPLAHVLALHSNDAASIRKAYEESKKDAPPAREEDVNITGYQMMQAGKLSQALEIMKINVELYPNSWNVYDSLGEVYLAIGDKENAKINYKKSLELNANNDEAKKALKKL